MKIELHKQSLADVAWSVLGGLIGGVATAVVFIHRYMSAPVHGEPQQTKMEGEK